MENICCGFGHRKIYGEIPLLSDTIKKLSEQGVTEFLTGGMGDFDRIFAETVRRVNNARLVLVLPYMTAELNKNRDFYESLYDEIIIPQCVEGMFPKAAIKQRNRWMVRKSSIAVGYITQNHGGAYDAMKYAGSIGKITIYL